MSGERGRRFGFGPFSRAWDAVLNNTVTVIAYLVMAAMLGGLVYGGYRFIDWALDERERRTEEAAAAAEADLVRSGDELAVKLGCQFVRTPDTPSEPGTIDLGENIETVDEGTCVTSGREVSIAVFPERRELESALGIIDGIGCEVAESFGSAGPFYGARGTWWLVASNPADGERASASDDREVAASIAELLDGSVWVACAP